MIRALLKKQLLELGAAFVRSSKTGKRRSRAGAFGYALLFAVLMLLVSPAGLPGIARLILENVSRVLGFFERMLT